MKQTKKQGILERFYYSSDEIIEKPFNWAQMWRLLKFMSNHIEKQFCRFLFSPY